jgi:biotin carboxyl carrier protein
VVAPAGDRGDGAVSIRLPTDCARLAELAPVRFVATIESHAETVEVTGAAGRYRLTIGGEVREVDARLTAPGIYSLLIDGVSYVADVTERDGACVVGLADEAYVIQVEEETRYVIRTKGGAIPGGGRQTLTAPLPGRVTHVAVKAGDTVAAGDTLLVIEAMKMENELRAGTSGTIAEVRVQPGQPVNAGDILVVIN